MSDRPVRDNSGALFKNDKGDNQNRPDYRGDITIGGVTYKLSAWIKEGRNGAKFMSLSATPQEGQQNSAPPAQQRSQPGAQRTRIPGDYPEPTGGRGGARAPFVDDDIPF